MKEKHLLGFRITLEQRGKLIAISKSENTPISVMLRESVKHIIKEWEKENGELKRIDNKKAEGDKNGTTV